MVRSLSAGGAAKHRWRRHGDAGSRRVVVLTEHEFVIQRSSPGSRSRQPDDVSGEAVPDGDRVRRFGMHAQARACHLQPRAQHGQDINPYTCKRGGAAPSHVLGRWRDRDGRVPLINLQKCRQSADRL